MVLTIKILSKNLILIHFIERIGTTSKGQIKVYDSLTIFKKHPYLKLIYKFIVKYFICLMYNVVSCIN